MTWAYYADFYDGPDLCSRTKAKVGQASRMSVFSCAFRPGMSLETLKVGGRSFNAHPHWEDLLRAAYGDQWRQPDVNYWKGERCVSALGGGCQHDKSWQNRGGTPARKPPENTVEFSTAIETPAHQCEHDIQAGIDMLGHDLSTVSARTTTADECGVLCCADAACQAFVFVTADVQGERGACWLKARIGESYAKANCAFGTVSRN